MLFNRLAVRQEPELALELLAKLAPKVGDALVKELVEADQSTEAGIAAQRQRVIARSLMNPAVGNVYVRSNRPVSAL